MAANSYAQKGRRHPPGYWGKWRGVECSVAECSEPVKVKGYCQSHYNKARWASGWRPPSHNADAHRTGHLRHRYGIDLDDYQRLLAEQGGVCAICGEPPTDSNTPAHWRQRLCVDHDEVTGLVRGLLCNFCNLAVGYGKSAATLAAAARYLSLHQ